MLSVGLVIDGWLPIGLAVNDVHAVVGRPTTPGSVAGVARRSVRRSAIYPASLSAGCTTVVIEGTSLYGCGGTYYQSSGGQYVVYVD